MTFVVGRRRIGKTRLLIKAAESSTYIYFFIAKKNESLLCNEFIEEIKQKLRVEIFGTFKTFKEIFGYHYGKAFIEKEILYYNFIEREVQKINASKAPKGQQFQI